MLEAFFQTVLYMSFSGGVLALVVLCLKAVFRNRIPAFIWLILWLLVAVRLLLPVKIESNLSLFNLDLLQKVEAFITDSGFEEGSRSNRYDISRYPDAEGFPRLEWYKRSVGQGGWAVSRDKHKVHP